MKPFLLNFGWLFTPHHLLTREFPHQCYPGTPTAVGTGSGTSSLPNIAHRGPNKPILIASNKGKFSPLRGCPHHGDTISQARSWDLRIRKRNHAFAADSFPAGCLAAVRTDACVQGLHSPPAGLPRTQHRNARVWGFLSDMCQRRGADQSIRLTAIGVVKIHR